MKTPEDIIAQFEPNDEYPTYYHETSIILMMKEYAKQWVKEGLKNEPDSFIEYYLKQIDEQ